MAYQRTTTLHLMSAGIDLLDASHILHFLEVVDAFGHVSLRNPDNSSQFLMFNSTRYEVENATAVGLTFNSSVVGAATPTGFAERFIHSEIYKKFPDVLARFSPFANQAGVPLVSQMHTAPSLGSCGAPIFDVRTLPRTILPDNQLHDLLGHGMAVRAASVRDVVFSSFYIKLDATVQLQGILLGGGTAPNALNQREVTDTGTTALTLVGRAWSLWVDQVDQIGLYTNDLRNKAAPTPTGF
ncbi:arad-like aldolase/epimerase [Favolaschia claudopus]|uniref:Arad-like aldolase/epimerase n=1 Tax=Favolaschia claudopus TaxID=2862362 RepID=A0AAW0EAA4_9AGAR